MVEQPENLNTHHRRQFREEILARLDGIDQKLDKLDHKVGSVALTLVGVERDIRRLTGSLGNLGAAVGEIDSRLAVIEKRDDQPHA